jgi:hypothetical protein
MGTRFKCLKCNDEIQSMYRHDFVECRCRNIFVDGGEEYTRFGGKGFMDNSYLIEHNGKLCTYDEVFKPAKEFKDEGDGI